MVSYYMNDPDITQNIKHLEMEIYNTKKNLKNVKTEYDNKLGIYSKGEINSIKQYIQELEQYIIDSDNLLQEYKSSNKKVVDNLQNVYDEEILANNYIFENPEIYEKFERLPFRSLNEDGSRNSWYKYTSGGKYKRKQCKKTKHKRKQCKKTKHKRK
jgi:hypothetical protein